MSQVQGDGKMGAKIEYIKPAFQLHVFQTEIGETKIVYQVLQMADSLLLFVNDKQHRQIDSLFLSMIDKYTGNPTYTRMLGSFSDEDASKVIACSLSKKLKKPVFVSCNLTSDISSLLILKQIVEEIARKPERF